MFKSARPDCEAIPTRRAPPRRAGNTPEKLRRGVVCRERSALLMYTVQNPGGARMHPIDSSGWFPPSDPQPSPDSPFAETMHAIGSALADGSPVPVPSFVGVTAREVVRWLYRARLACGRGWVPLVCIDPRRVAHPREVMLEATDEAAGGWLWLEAGWQRHWDAAALQLRTHNRHTQLLLASDQEPVPVAPSVAQRLIRLDRFHLVASDPSIDRLRRAALAHCRADGLLFFSGPPGTGKRSLARWAHAQLGDARPLGWVRGGGSGPARGRWTLYEELGQLSAAQLEPLRELLQDGNRHVLPGVHDEDVPARPDEPGLAAIVGQSPALCRVLAKAARYARSRLPILIRGESGCGKELLAEAVHSLSRRGGRFVAIDLSAKNVNLVESELFGHVPGAFTGARTARKGALVEADGGTIFLDELGNLSLASQAKLLRFLESRTIQPVGSDKSQDVDVRVIAATNADLEDMVCSGSFRRDLLYRFNPNAALVLPPLRERVEDIVPLARTFIARCLDAGPVPRIEPEAAAMLESWSWPGNIRELRHVAESAVVEAEGGDISARALRRLIDASSGPAPVIATCSDAATLAAHSSLLPGELRQLTAISLRFPTLAERGRSAVRNAVLAQLDGRPIRRAALRALERYPWWGNLFELRSCMEALKANQPGEVDLSGVQDQLPELLTGESRAPIRVLLFPSVLPGGVVRGLEQSYSEAALVVGRASQFDELRPGEELGAAAPERLLRRRWSVIHSIIGDIIPACLPVDFLAKLSRAHLILTREHSGLCVHVLPGVSLQTLAGPLANDELFEIEPGASVSLEEAGEVVVLAEDGQQPYLRFFVFAGDAASHDWADRLGQRMAGTPNDRTVGAPRGGHKAWQLNSGERRALGDLVVEALSSARPFATTLREGAAHWTSGGGHRLWRLAEYLDSAHPTQSCARLVAFGDNEILRRELRSRLGRLEDPLAAWSQLPTRLRSAVPQPGPAHE